MFNVELYLNGSKKYLENLFFWNHFLVSFRRKIYLWDWIYQKVDFLRFETFQICFLNVFYSNFAVQFTLFCLKHAKQLSMSNCDDSNLCPHLKLEISLYLHKFQVEK